MFLFHIGKLVYIFIYVKRYIVENLQSHFILTMSHWSSGLTLCFLSQGTWVQIPWGGLMWNQDSPVSLSRYIGDPHVIDHHCDLVWGGPRLRWASSQTITRPSSRQCDNPTWSHTAFLSRFHARSRSPFRLHNWRSPLLGGEPCGEPAISLHSHHVSLVLWTNPFASRHKGPGFQSPGGYLCETGILLLVMSRYNI